MQKIFIGKLGKGVREFYGSTLREIQNAIAGFDQLRNESHQEYMLGVRKICFWTMRGLVGKKIKREEDLFALEIDAEIRRARVKNMKPIKVTRG